MLDRAHLYGNDEPSQHEVHPGVALRTVDTEFMSVNRYAFAPHARFPLHRHPEEQIVYVISGQVEFVVEDVVHVIEPGGLLVIPSGAVHGVTAGSNGARVLSVVAPRRTQGMLYLEEERLGP